MQETQKWLNARSGKFSSSRISDLLTKGKRDMTEAELKAREKGNTRKTIDIEFGDTAMTYIKEVTKEILTGIPKSNVTTFAMQWGIDNEPIAARRYAEIYPDFEYFGGENPKFFPSDDNWSGGSPDGLRPDPVIEIKCPDTDFLEYLYISKGCEFGSFVPYMGTLNDWLKSFKFGYYCQIQYNMVVCKKKYAHLVVFDPRILEYKDQMVILKIDADKELQDEIVRKIDLAAEIVINCLNLLEAS